MRNINKMRNLKWLFVLSILFSTIACEKDLDIVPRDDDDFTSENFYADPASYKQFLAKIYAGLAVTGQKGPDGDSDLGTGDNAVNEGFSAYLRGYWQLQELTTDEAIIAWQENDNPTIKDLNFNTWNADNVFAEAYFARIFFQIGLCNEYLRQTTEEKLSSRGVSESEKTNIRTYRAEVRFLRALSYYHGIDIFGKLPFGTETDALGTPPQMQSRQFVFDFILSELNAIDPELKEPRTNEYGRADKAAAWMLKSKLLINAQVYTGTDRSDEALAAVNNVIGSSYKIRTGKPYSDLFKADNHRNGAEEEIIFPIVFDGRKTQSWGGMTYLLHASCTSEVGLLIGIDFGWAGFRVRKEFADKVGTSDPRVMYVPGNTDPATITDYTQFAQGKKLIKFSNLNSDGTPGQDLTQGDADFPMFRMADAYLMYAELAVVNGKGNMGTALQYVNDLRTRVGAANVTLADLNADFILNERAKELYWEGMRRQDLIRFGKYLSGYNWQWKGGVQNGVDLPAHRLLFAIPAKELSSNPNLSQNTGY